MTENASAVRKQLISMGVGSSDPRWSSYALDQLFKMALQESDRAVGDIFQEAYTLLADAELTQPVANWIKDTAVLAYSGYRDSYESCDLTWISKELERGCSASQAYFALFTIPPEAMSSASASVILTELRETEFFAEAVANLDDDDDS